MITLFSSIIARILSFQKIVRYFLTDSFQRVNIERRLFRGFKTVSKNVLKEFCKTSEFMFEISLWFLLYWKEQLSIHTAVTQMPTSFNQKYSQFRMVFSIVKVLYFYSNFPRLCNTYLIGVCRQKAKPVIFFSSRSESSRSPFFPVAFSQISPFFVVFQNDLWDYLSLIILGNLTFNILKNFIYFLTV